MSLSILHFCKGEVKICFDCVEPIGVFWVVLMHNNFTHKLLDDGRLLAPFLLPQSLQLGEVIFNKCFGDWYSVIRIALQLRHPQFKFEFFVLGFFKTIGSPKKSDMRCSMSALGTLAFHLLIVPLLRPHAVSTSLIGNPFSSQRSFM